MQHCNIEVAVLAKQLPLKLRVGLQLEVLELAVADNIIQITAEGKLRWMLGNNTLLAYFCGRMWCGDVARRRRRSSAVCWVPGNRRFPTASLHQLFNSNNLDVLRRNRKFSVLPEGYELIENLFIAAESRT